MDTVSKVGYSMSVEESEKTTTLTKSIFRHAEEDQTISAHRNALVPCGGSRRFDDLLETIQIAQDRCPYQRLLHQAHRSRNMI